MQREILEENPAAAVRVYAVWLPILPGDSPDTWDEDLMPDIRVTHYWDQGRLVGTFFAETGQPGSGVAWDIYFLYGNEAEWGTAPGPLLSSGYTVIGSSVKLQRDLLLLLEK